MRSTRILLIAFLALLGAVAGAQSWQSAYDAGIKAARSGLWAEARASFQQAAAYRTEDVSGPTTLPGPVTEQRRWRNGAAYSPNFLAAYSEYRLGLAAATPEQATPALQTAAGEFEALLAKGQHSRETYFFLNQIYTRLSDTAKRMDLEERYRSAKPTFRVDTEVVSPEEMSVIGGGSTSGNNNTGPQITVIKAGQQNPIPAGNSLPGANTLPGTVNPAVGPVAPLATKYALVIGNASSRMPNYSVPFGADDAQAIREALITHAGYPDANVDLVLNATRDQILASVKALADRLPDDATVFIFFAGSGANINGKDFLAGVDTDTLTDASSMVAKNDIYKMFMTKGARMFSFYEVPRPVTNGRYFGQEVPLLGAISQCQSTIPNGGVYSMTRNGRTLGMFADAIASSMADIRSNQIAITEFGWQVFNRIRGGGPGVSGTGATQIPTLPVLTHLAPDEKF